MIMLKTTLAVYLSAACQALENHPYGSEGGEALSRYF